MLLSFCGFLSSECFKSLVQFFLCGGIKNRGFRMADASVCGCFGPLSGVWLLMRSNRRKFPCLDWCPIGLRAHYKFVPSQKKIAEVDLRGPCGFICGLLLWLKLYPEWTQECSDKQEVGSQTDARDRHRLLLPVTLQHLRYSNFFSYLKPSRIGINMANSPPGPIARTLTQIAAFSLSRHNPLPE